ncbi:MAG: FAD-dependent oxidoreductase, partial [Syntrophaceae bacterium]|nr:FAD-dependent oxidoreductase [Syntrophaceae bacterium]
MDQKIGVYICSGCGIGEAIDCQALGSVAEDFKVAKVEHSEMLCSASGLETINADISSGAVNCAVIAACSGRVKTAEFCFDPMSVISERLNIREHVAWCQPAGEEDTQMMADDYMRMAITRVQKTTLPKPYMEEIDKNILVIGGGVTGLQAALEAAKADYKVILAEKEAVLGGQMVNWHKNTPTKAPYHDLSEINVQDTIDQVTSNPNITVKTGVTIEKIAGAPGMFDVTFSNGGGASRVGSVVLAAGWKPYDASRLEHLGFGKFPDVITNVQMEEMAKSGNIVSPSDGSPASVVAFIQCAGSRDQDHLPYCSAVCCRVSLKQAVYVKEANEENKAIVFYKDMRTPEQAEEFYKKVQKDGVVFVKTDTSKIQISEGSERKLTIETMDELLGEPIQIEADLVVLATGMQPATIDD